LQVHDQELNMVARSYSYRVIGTNQETGRSNTRTYQARSDLVARGLAYADGIEPYTIELLPPELPTDAQLSYAADLEIAVPGEISKEDLGELIGMRTNRDRPPRPALREFAEQYGVFYPDMIGKKSLFNRIFWALKAPGREYELCSWFAYRVYRDLMGGSILSRIQSPFESTIQEVAAKLAGNRNVVHSIGQYHNGADFVWFGTWTAPDGALRAGGSKRSLAYQEAVKLLQPIVDAEKADEEEMMRKANMRRDASFNPLVDTGGEDSHAAKQKKVWLVVAILLVIAVALAVKLH
jgi:hypothetical protein